jgi:hypothetical protein
MVEKGAVIEVGILPILHMSVLIVFGIDVFENVRIRSVHLK